VFKLWEAIAEISYWLGIFLSPFLTSGLLAYITYFSLAWPLYISIVLLIGGCICGILLAEYIRKKYGCSAFWARLSGSPHIEEKNDKQRERRN
jgi:hypothetical protein